MRIFTRLIGGVWDNGWEQIGCERVMNSIRERTQKMQLTSRLNLGSTFKHTFRNSTSTIIQSINLCVYTITPKFVTLFLHPPFSRSKKPHNQKQLCILQDLIFTRKAVSKMFKFGNNLCRKLERTPTRDRFFCFNYRGWVSSMINISQMCDITAASALIEDVFVLFLVSVCELRVFFFLSVDFVGRWTTRIRWANWLIFFGKTNTNVKKRKRTLSSRMLQFITLSRFAGCISPYPLGMDRVGHWTMELGV